MSRVKLVGQGDSPGLEKSGKPKVVALESLEPPPPQPEYATADNDSLPAAVHQEEYQQAKEGKGTF